MKALEIFEELARRFPSNDLADDALLKAGDITRLILMNPEDSIRFYREATKKKGDMEKIALKILSSLEKEPPQSYGPLSNLQEAMWWVSDKYARINIILSQKTDYRYETIKEGEKIKGLKINIINSKTEEPKKTVFEGGLLKSINIENCGKNICAEILFEEIGGYQIFYFLFPFTIVLDIFEKNYRREDIIASVIERYEKSEKKERKFIVVRDPGHGGNNTGAVGRKIKEKDVVLKIAKKLKKILEEDGFVVRMTREEDVSLPLSARVAFANSIKADMFISLHINASHNKQARGIEVYYFDKSFDKSDLHLLAAENEMKNISESQSDLDFILNDLMLTSRNTESAFLARDIKDELLNALNYKKYRTKDVKGGPFYVLMNAAMPAVLVETLFITNPEEEKLLMKEEILEKIAMGIYSGIKRYIMRTGEI